MITSFTHTEPGGHPENEDRFEVRPVPGGPGCYLCAVADGQGGRSGGVRGWRRRSTWRKERLGSR